MNLDTLYGNNSNVIYDPYFGNFVELITHHDRKNDNYVR